MINLGGAAPTLSPIRLGECAFAFVETLTPERNVTGAVREFGPQGGYAKASTVMLHKHGHGTFCKFHIAVPRGLTGVYALVVDDTVHYIGKCVDLGKRFNAGYGTIHPRNCYEGGQQTNCKINRRVLDVSKGGGRVELYFHPTPQRQTVEKQLIARYLPPWNG